MYRTVLRNSVHIICVMRKCTCIVYVMYVCTYKCKKSAISVEVGIDERVIADPSGICGAQNASQLKSLAWYI
jgi:hypothetical protein